MVRCDVCKEGLPAGDFVSCAGCDGGLHFGCSGLSRATWGSKGEAKRLEWRCKGCRLAFRQRRDVDASAGTSRVGQDVTQVTATATIRQGGTDTQTTASQRDVPCTMCGRLFRTERALSGHVSRVHPVAGADTDGVPAVPSTAPCPFHVTLAALRGRVRVIPRIPKGARILAAEKLAATISATVNVNDEASWQQLLLFSFSTLGRQDCGKKTSLTTHIKNNLAAFRGGLVHSVSLPSETAHTTRGSTCTSTSRRAQAKLGDGDVRGAVRLLCSEDDVATFSRETFEELKKKHPPAKLDASFPDPPQRTPSSQRTTGMEVREAVRSFAAGSAGGPDGLRPQHLKDLLAATNGEAAEELARALAELVDLMLEGRVPEAVCPYLYGATLTALKKKDGGIRPIAVGNTIRRLAAKIGCRRAQDAMGAFLRPHQLGFGTPGGAEAAVHSARRFVEDPGPPRVLLKVDFKNAFNSMYRNHMLSSMEADAPPLYPLAWQCYRSPSMLSFGDYSLESAEGCQQGDPLGPLLFCIGLQPLCQVLRSSLNMWYLDDGTLGGPLHTIIEDVKTTQAFSERSGLALNPTKCEVFFVGHSPEEEAAALESLEEVLPGIRHTSRAALRLLGSPLTDEAIPSVLREKDAAAVRMGERLEEWSPHYALFIMKNCLAVPKLIYTIRTCPSWRFREELGAIDETFRSILQTISNTNIDGATWCQASLPVGRGGLGIRRIEELAIPAFLASSYSTAPLVAELLSRVREGSMAVNAEDLLLDRETTDAEEAWLDETERLSGARLARPPLEQRGIQKKWDEPLTDQRLQNLLGAARLALHSAVAHQDPASEQLRQATANVSRLLAAATKESGLWLQVLPSPSLGTYLNPDALRVAVALRLGAPICADHTCRCGMPSNVLGHHGLSCRLSAGRHPRHHALNDVVRRALGSAGVPSRLEPTGLAHDAGLRADGLSMVPWSEGKSITWDVTCVDTFAASHVASTSLAPRAAANRAEELKRVKYRPLVDRYIFAPLGFETTGTFGESCSSLVRDIGRRITAMTGEARATEFLRQRLSVEIQRGNALAIIGTFPPSRPFDEMFLLA